MTAPTESSTIPAGLRSRWLEEGWGVWQRAIPDADLWACEGALSHLFPSAAEMDSGIENDETSKWRNWDAAWPEFPFRSKSLNRLALHPSVLDLAEELLQTDDIRFYMGLITAKYANQSSHYNQLLHTDFPNNMVLVPSADDRYRQLELFLYLTGVSIDNGATRMVSVKRTSDIPVERHTLSFGDYGDLYDDSGAAVGPAGSIVCYRPDVYHRSVDWSEPGKRRIMMHLSFRPAEAEWGGYQAWPIKGFSPEWHAFVAGAGPRELSTVGFPRPGHPYWTPQTIAGVSARYPGLEMAPWNEAIGA